MMSPIKNIFLHRQTIFLFALFFLIRIFSYFFSPLFLVQNITSGILLLLLIFLFFKKNNLAWYLIIGEIFLGGSGHFLEFFGISIRTLFLCTYISLYIGHLMFSKEKSIKLLLPLSLYWLFGLFFLALLIAITQGMILHNDSRLIFQDTIPFAFFALLLPMHQMLRDKNNQLFIIRLVGVFILGSAIFSLFTFILFSTHTALIQGPYYKWFRDIIGGKLTDLGNGFWRVVSPEHLLVLPLFVIIASLLMKKHASQKILFLPFFAALFILTLNLSRGYFLALVCSLGILLYTHHFKKWFSICILSGVSIGILFCLTSFIASEGKTFGLEQFGLRLHSFTSPKIEESTYTRSSLVQPILEKFKTQPVLGTGLGSTVTFINPISKTPVTTPQFDWGYLEILTEFGLIGSFCYLLIIGFTLSLTVISIQTVSLQKDFLVGMLGGMGALLIATITAPALFHVFGVCYMTGLLSLILSSNESSEVFKLHWKKFIHRFI